LLVIGFQTHQRISFASSPFPTARRVEPKAQQLEERAAIGSLQPSTAVSDSIEYNVSHWEAAFADLNKQASNQRIEVEVWLRRKVSIKGLHVSLFQRSQF
jgi:hypothetical protein